MNKSVIERQPQVVEFPKERKGLGFLVGLFQPSKNIEKTESERPPIPRAGTLKPLDLGSMKKREARAEEAERKAVINDVNFIVPVPNSITFRSSAKWYERKFADLSVVFAFNNINDEVGAKVADQVHLPGMKRNRFIKKIQADVESYGEVSPETLSRLNINVRACRFANSENGEVVEQRLYLDPKDNDNTFIATISAKDHWQKAHSHKTSIESYTVLKGTMALVTEVTEKPELYKVEVLSKLGPGSYYSGCFLYNKDERRVVDSHGVTHAERQMSPAFTTQTGLQHNVFLFDDTVIGTWKEASGYQLKRGEVDRSEEQGFGGDTGFDGELNQRNKLGVSVADDIVGQVREQIAEARG